ncbi:MAG: hypothetical protein ACRC1M_04680 [Methanobacteriaceae archaeon]
MGHRDNSELKNSAIFNTDFTQIISLRPSAAYAAGVAYERMKLTMPLLDPVNPFFVFGRGQFGPVAFHLPSLDHPINVPRLILYADLNVNDLNLPDHLQHLEEVPFQAQLNAQQVVMEDIIRTAIQNNEQRFLTPPLLWEYPTEFSPKPFDVPVDSPK